MRAAFATLALAAALVVPLSAHAAPARAPHRAAAGNRDAEFNRLADEYLGHVLRTRPQLATRRGIHIWDAVLVPVTQNTLARDAAWFHAFQNRLAAIPRAALGFERGLEYDLLVARVDRELLDLEVVRPFENNPNAYLDLIAGSIQSLLDRNFAPVCRRVDAVTRRLRQVPEVLRAAKINLRTPPRIYTEVAISQFQGTLRLYREQVPAVGARCRDPRAQADLSEADTLAILAVTDFISYLREDLLARSTGSFALGREAYERKLRDDELETTPSDSLLARGWRAIATTRARMAELAERIAPGQGVPAALESLSTQHPDADQLVKSVAADLDSIRSFLRHRDLLTMPLHENLRVRETPVFARSLSFASMDAPGVWEKKATEAYYNVTPADPGWSAAEQRDHLAFFNRWAAPVISIHEALPGHYYQFLGLARVPSRLRQFLGSGANSEGWAHYCEQMMIEQGFGDGDPRFELAQQLLALQRLGRLVVGISLHTQNMSYEDAVKVFQEQCYMPPVNAAREARRGTLDPTYLVYTLGKWHILDLRDEMKERLGARFRLKDFHDRFLRQGNSALPVVRAAMLHEIETGR